MAALGAAPAAVAVAASAVPAPVAAAVAVPATTVCAVCVWLQISGASYDTWVTVSGWVRGGHRHDYRTASAVDWPRRTYCGCTLAVGRVR